MTKLALQDFPVAMVGRWVLWEGMRVVIIIVEIYPTPVIECINYVEKMK